MNKELILKRFTKAAPNYKKQAIVQQNMVLVLIELVQFYCKGRTDKIVEIGCGPGTYSRELISAFPSSQIILNDLCPAMQDSLHDILNHNVSFESNDAEKWVLPDYIDLLTSSSTFQWFTDLKGFLQRSTSRLSATGMIAFSTFGPQNMQEIASISGSGLDYLSCNQLGDILQENYKIHILKEETIKLHFADALEVLYHLKNTGVTGISKQHWTRGMIRDFCTKYSDLYSDEQGVYLTYHPIYVIASKKENKL